MNDEEPTDPPFWDDPEDIGQPDDEECPFCGADLMDGCECHEDILGFPMGCPED